MMKAQDVRRILDAARRHVLSAEHFDTLVTSFESQDDSLRQLSKDCRVLRDALDLCRQTIARLEGELVSLRSVLDHTLNTLPQGQPGLAARKLEIARPQSDLSADYALSPDARRILSGLAAERRVDFWSNELRTLSRGLGSPEIEFAVKELLDYNLIEELSYAAFEGTHYSCTPAGKELLDQIVRKSR
jgi:hypothetical protein